jgi:hypothetical protein
MLANAVVAQHPTLDACGELQVAATAGDDASALVIAAIGQARQQSPIQAYRLNHRTIADALFAAPWEIASRPVARTAFMTTAIRETLNKWLRGRIAAKRGVGFGRPLSRP